MTDMCSSREPCKLIWSSSFSYLLLTLMSWVTSLLPFSAMSGQTNPYELIWVWPRKCVCLLLIFCWHWCLAKSLHVCLEYLVLETRPCLRSKFEDFFLIWQNQVVLSNMFQNRPDQKVLIPFKSSLLSLWPPIPRTIHLQLQDYPCCPSWTIRLTAVFKLSWT